MLVFLLVAPAAAADHSGVKTAKLAREGAALPRLDAPPVNDQCSGAILISCASVSGNINLSGTTLFATNDYTFTDTLNSCTGYKAEGKDVVYKMSVGPGDSLWVDYTTITDGSIYLVTDCGNIDGSCVAGSDKVAEPGQVESIRYRFVTGGTYYLILDSYAPASSGDWTMVGQLICGPSTPPPNDLWEAATRINCGGFTYEGSTQFANDNYTLGPFPCTGHVADGHDVVYKVVVTAGDSLYLEYTNTSNGSVYIVGNGNQPNQTCVWGEDQNITGGIEVIHFRFEYTGTYYVILDTRDAGTWGTYVATGQLVCLNPPPPNDRCEGATLLPCGDFNLAGSTQYAFNDYLFTGVSSCTGYEANGKDVVYRIDAAAGDSVWVDYLSVGSDGSVYILNDCTNPDGACVVGQDDGISDETEQLRYRFTNAGTYYLILDSVDSGTWGQWTASGGFICGPVGVEDRPRAMPLELRGATPNPFSLHTAITWALPVRGPATLRVYDLQGRVARTLFDGVADAGEHRVNWDGRDDQGARVGPGVYFARLVGGGASVFQRMIFVK